MEEDAKRLNYTSVEINDALIENYFARVFLSRRHSGKGRGGVTFSARDARKSAVMYLTRTPHYLSSYYYSYLLYLISVYLLTA